MAIAEHEHVPEIAASSIGRYLLKDPDGPARIRDMMRDDIHAALGRGDKDHASELLMVLRDFLSAHPEARDLRSLVLAGRQVGRIEIFPLQFTTGANVIHVPPSRWRLTLGNARCCC